MPRRKYAGPLQPGKRSAKVSKAVPRTKIDKKQSTQIATLQKQVKALKEVNTPEQFEYQLQYQQVGVNGAAPNMINLINYNNDINYTLSDVISRTFKSMNVRIHLRGDQSGQSPTDSHRPVRVIFFLYKCDVYKSAIPGAGNSILDPTLDDLFDGVASLSNTNLAMSRMSFRNRQRIKILKDSCFSLTNHSGEENDRLISFKYYFKHKNVYANVNKNDDLIKSASFWMPYVIVLDPLNTNRAYWSMVNQVVATTEK